MKRAWFIAGVLVCVPLMAAAQGAPVPSLINYQATVTDGAGEPLEDGTGYEIAFRIWDDPSTGNLIWGQAYTITIVGSRFNVILGPSGTPVTDGVGADPKVNDIGYAFTGGERFLGITVTRDKDGEEIVGATEITPRQQIISAPYALQAKNGVPPGSIMPFAGSTPPDGWLLCDGSTYDTDAYENLGAVLGATWGVAPAGEFKVPDLRGRALIGAGQGAGLTTRSLAQTLGAETHTLTIAEMPSHNHSYNDVRPSQTYRKDFAGLTGTNDVARTTDMSDTARTTGSRGGGDPHNIMQPSAVVNYIIKY
jgi:microcystin-dependent protein